MQQLCLLYNRVIRLLLSLKVTANKQWYFIHVLCKLYCSLFTRTLWYLQTQIAKIINGMKDIKQWFHNSNYQILDGSDKFLNSLLSYMHQIVTDFYSIPYQGLFSLTIASTVATFASIAHFSHSSKIKYY
jgi:hypothetical protein